jgi:hypothetical protein
MPSARSPHSIFSQPIVLRKRGTKASSPIFWPSDRPSPSAARGQVVLAELVPGDALVPEGPDQRHDEAVLTGHAHALAAQLEAFPILPLPGPASGEKMQRERLAIVVAGGAPELEGARHVGLRHREATVERVQVGPDEQPASERSGRPHAFRDLDRFAHARVCRREVLDPLESRRELHEGSRLCRAIPGLAGEVHDYLGLLPAAREVADPEEELGARATDPHERGHWHSVTEPARGLQRAGMELQRLAQPERPGGLLGGLEEVIERPLPVLRLREVVREHLVVLGKSIGVELLDGATDQPVQVLAPLHEQRVVGDVLRERVLEHVRQLGVETSLVDQLERGQLAEELLGALADLREAIDEAPRELAADHRGELERPLRRLLQAVDARGDDVVDRAGDRQLVEGRRDLEPPAGAAKGATLLQ